MGVGNSGVAQNTTSRGVNSRMLLRHAHSVDGSCDPQIHAREHLWPVTPRHAPGDIHGAALPESVSRSTRAPALTMPPDERVWLDHREERAPVQQA
jgi:hypothetical protein